MQIEFCFITLDVKWDLGAAIVLEEAQRFGPSLILMSGRGGDNMAHLEWGAINHSDGIAGYNSDGSISSDNEPVSSYILKDDQGEVQSPIAMTWSGQMLADLSARLAAEIGMGASFIAESEARVSNDYICNNVSFIVLQAIAGRTVRLAGETLELTLPHSDIRSGFFHYPIGATNKPKEISGWVAVIANIVRASLLMD